LKPVWNATQALLALKLLFDNPPLLLHYYQSIAHGLENGLCGRCFVSTFHQSRDEDGLPLNTIARRRDMSVGLP
jgi:hypothetical protein